MKELYSAGKLIGFYVGTWGDQVVFASGNVPGNRWETSFNYISKSNVDNYEDSQAVAVNSFDECVERLTSLGREYINDAFSARLEWVMNNLPDFYRNLGGESIKKNQMYRNTLQVPSS